MMLKVCNPLVSKFSVLFCLCLEGGGGRGLSFCLFCFVEGGRWDEEGRSGYHEFWTNRLV